MGHKQLNFEGFAFGSSAAIYGDNVIFLYLKYFRQKSKSLLLISPRMELSPSLLLVSLKISHPGMLQTMQTEMTTGDVIGTTSLTLSDQRLFAASTTH